MIIDLLYLLRRKIAMPSKTGRIEYAEWLESLGWKLAESGYWIEPATRGTEWTFRTALRLSAEAEAARALRALGWYAPNTFGRVNFGFLCRAPGTWTSLPGIECRAVKGSGGRWLSLSQATRAAGLRYWESPAPDRPTA
jgi:hypothetical protein